MLDGCLLHSVQFDPGLRNCLSNDGQQIFMSLQTLGPSTECQLWYRLASSDLLFIQGLQYKNCFGSSHM